MVPWNSTSEGFTYMWHSRWEGIITIKTERTLIQFLSDILVALALLDLKVPVGRDSMEHTLYWCSGSSLHCLRCRHSNGYLLTWWNRSDWWLTDLKVCSLRWCPLLLCWQKQDITINTVYHSCLCKHRLLAKTNSLLIRSIRRTLTAEHEVVGSNPDCTTTKPGLQKPLYGCIFLLCSCITLACLVFILLVAGPHPPSGCHSISQPDYSGTYPLVHLYSKDNSIQRTQNSIPENCSHFLYICYLYWRDTSFQGKGTLLPGPKNQV